MVIAGPTAAGKTGLALELAARFNTEIISADSRQIYREMDIGTAKPSQEELSRVKHHFINSHSIDEDYDAASFGEDALRVIHRIFERNDFAILCGGSGLYIKAVCEGFDEIPEVPGEIREQLVKNFNEHGLTWLQQKMAELDPQYLARIDQQNPQRLMRALEVKIGTGMSITDFRKNEKRKHDFRIVKIGLELPREELYHRIDSRMDQMIAAGLFEEARKFYPLRSKNALQTVGYQEIFDFIDGAYDEEEAVRLLKRNSRRYAKRQLTWFKKDEEIVWYRPDQISEIIEFIISQAS
jgi:tRNA dimethylallyltransferase